MNEKFELFLSRLDKFIDKHYKVLSIKGIFTFLQFFFISFLLISIIGSVFSLSSKVRFFILLLFLFSNSFVFVNFIVWPILKMFNIFSRISYETASRIIQENNEQLKDNLINILQLSKLDSTDLVCASIEQKIDSIKDFDFSETLKFNLKNHIFSFSIVFIIGTFLFMAIPNLYRVGAKNIFHYSQSNINLKTLDIYIDKSSLIVEEGEDLQIDAVVAGNYRLDELFISLRENRFLMQRQNDTLFTYLFKNVNNDFSFSIVTDEFNSETFNVKVLRIPVINNNKTEIYYPKYLNKSDTIVNNSNILIVPQGTILKHLFWGSHFDSLKILSLSDSSLLSFPNSDTVVYKKRILKNENFKVILSNKDLVKDFVEFKIVCVPDLYPELSVSRLEELTNQNSISFNGLIKDDYGFTKLNLLINQNSRTDTLLVPIYPNFTTQQIFYNYQNEVNSDISDKYISFCFELFDNDAVNGPKKVKSKIIEYVVKSISKQTEEKEKQYGDLFRQLELSKQLSAEIEFDIMELRRKSINSNLSEWEKNNILQQITNKTNQLEEFLNNILQTQNQIENNAVDNQRIIEKQNLVSEMLESLVDEELKKILQEISELANEQMKHVNNLSEDLKRDFGNFEKSIDKDLELLKKIKIEENMQQISDNLNLLSEKQHELSSSFDNDSLSSNLESQIDFFNDIHKQFNDMVEQNKSLEKPMDIEDFNSSFDDIQSNFEKESQQLNNPDKEDFNNTARDNSEKLKDLASKMNNMLNSNSAESDAEDADDLRQVLDNLFEVSYNQEYIITNFERVNINNPAYQDRILAQSQLLDNYKIVKDSLYALSRRSVFLGSHISNTAFLIEDDMIKSCRELQDQESYKANRSQHDALKQTNDLILLLSESLKNVESNSSSSSGKSIKNKKQKPKKDGQSLSDMRNAQESIKNQMKNLLNQMKSGDSQKINQELAKSLIQNEIYQQMLQQMMMSSEIDGKTAKLLQEVKKLMEKNHSDLANKQLSVQTVMRQQSIVTKLLDAENAENERDKDERRESNVAKNIRPNTPKNLEEDITFGKNIDFLQKNNLRLNSFFKTKFEEYLNSVNTDDYE